MEIKRNNVERLDVKKIVLNEETIKENDYQLYEKLKKSIELRGQLKNIVVCELENGQYECLEGSKIVKILRELSCDFVLSVNLGKLSQEERNIIRIEISRDYFVTNYVQIGVLLKELSKNIKLQDLCNSFPYTVRQCENLISMTEFDWDEFNQNKQIEGQISIFDVFDEEEEDEPLQTWQETVLEITQEETTDWVEKMDYVEEAVVEDVKIIQPVIDLEQNVLVKDETGLFVELNSIKELSVEEKVKEEPSFAIDFEIFDITEQSIEKEEEIDYNYKLESEELLIFNNNDYILEQVVIAAKTYMEHKYNCTEFADIKRYYESNEHFYTVKYIQFTDQNGVFFNLKPHLWISYLNVEAINNKNQTSLF